MPCARYTRMHYFLLYNIIVTRFKTNRLLTGTYITTAISVCNILLIRILCTMILTIKLIYKQFINKYIIML